jgi:hypothetical protein
MVILPLPAKLTEYVWLDIACFIYGYEESSFIAIRHLHFSCMNAIGFFDLATAH